MRPLSTHFRPFALFVLSTAVLFACEPPPPREAGDDPREAEVEQALGGCGVERWSVKTGTDADVSTINFTPQNTTIASLRAIAAPSPLPANNRIAPFERQVFRLTDVTLTVFKLESDSDYHLVLSDGAQTMIAEIAAPACVGASSPLLTGIRAARTAFDARFTPSSSFTTANIPVTLTGVGFFDFQHGQRGVAPNGIELHAVLGICFGAGCDHGGPSNDFSVSISPTTGSVARSSSTTFQINTATTSGSAQTVTLSISGLPTGVSGTFNPTSVMSGGSSTLTLRASAGATVGTSTFTVTGNAPSGSHGTPGMLTVTGPSSAFTIALTPTQISIPTGSSGAIRVSASGAQQNIRLSVQGLPSGVTGTFSPTSISPGSSSTLTLRVSRTARRGTSPITVSGTGTASTQTAPGSLIVR